MTTSVPRNESELQQYRVLERANLLQYFDMFISQGGDDVRQLCEAGEDEFLEIMALVGMASKPLHVRRLQKALQEWLNYPAKFQQPYVESAHQNIKEESLLRNNNSVFPCLTETISQASQTGNNVSHEDKIKLNDSVKFISKTLQCESNLDLVEKLNFNCPIADIEALFVSSELTLSQIDLIAKQSELLINNILDNQQDLIKEAAKLLCISTPTLLTNREQLLHNCFKVISDIDFKKTSVLSSPSKEMSFDENFSIKDRIKELDDNILLLTNRQEAIIGTDAASRDNIAAIQTLLNKLTAERNDMLCNTKQHPRLNSKGLTTLRDDDENSMKIAKMDMNLNT